MVHVVHIHVESSNWPDFIAHRVPDDFRTEVCVQVYVFGWLRCVGIEFPLTRRKSEGEAHKETSMDMSMDILSGGAALLQFRETFLEGMCLHVFSGCNWIVWGLAKNWIGVEQCFQFQFGIQLDIFRRTNTNGATFFYIVNIPRAIAINVSQRFPTTVSILYNINIRWADLYVLRAYNCIPHVGRDCASHFGCSSLCSGWMWKLVYGRDKQTRNYCMALCKWDITFIRVSDCNFANTNNTIECSAMSGFG